MLSIAVNPPLTRACDSTNLAFGLGLQDSPSGSLLVESPYSETRRMVLRLLSDKAINIELGEVTFGLNVYPDGGGTHTAICPGRRARIK